mmetsp:Transcript_13625/g.20426  ORF Transcript_13625/g.20426 Transcript_13625/m.20426 type:complete len:268 (+) Transcript_13625:132-935(+)|eukprot:CAMPEP_0185040080 /NCGR_PEP_ID=MMETSP1103-20130426/37706_1 /TAXON_ID=36769 /ORGANISM="Paraphysomonas bandaiensis, Strain Caron Lab Isolate" /LENGTH=267 /DNA_ID=CAMNT_0027579235 /DNA_START=79 /DNA_END=882 /DNA_ORIENTATION=-
MSEIYFSQTRKKRDGQELFNVSGEKFALLNEVIDKNARKIKERDEKKKPVNYAVRRVNELLEQKKSENVRRRLYDSPMSLATKMAIYGDEYHLRKELDRGYPFNFRDATTGRTLLHEAAVNGHLHLVRMLCREYKAKTNVYTIMGLVTPLHLSVAKNYRMISVILCQNGAHTNCKNIQGCTPLHYVKSKTILKVLLRYGADPLIRNKDGLTPREHYLKYTEVIDQDPQIAKKLLQVEEEHVRAQFSEEIQRLQAANADKRGSDVAIY